MSIHSTVHLSAIDMMAAAYGYSTTHDIAKQEYFHSSLPGGQICEGKYVDMEPGRETAINHRNWNEIDSVGSN